MQDALSLRMATWWADGAEHQTHKDAQIYTSLDRTRRVIRLLELRPGIDADAVRVRLVTADLDSPHDPYYAVSYAWESREPHYLIHLNGIPHEIPIKQWQILRALRTKLTGQSTPVLLWIDLLCIDQSSTEDKNRQVSLMGDIFAKAECVYAWISNHASLAVSYASMLEIEYWLRRWVVQELTLAREIHLLFGQASLTWDQLWIRSSAGRKKADLLRESGGRQWTTINNIRYLRGQDAMSSPKPRLHHLLSLFSHTNSSNPYDNIYALLSLTSVTEQKRVVVDYHKSLFRLFFEVANLIDPEEESSSFPVLDTLYLDFRSKSTYQTVPGYSAFASLSTSLKMESADYYGSVVSAYQADMRRFPEASGVDAWHIVVRREGRSSDTTNSQHQEKWLTVLPYGSGVSAIRPDDICFQVSPFWHRVFIFRRGRADRSKMKYVARAERYSETSNTDTGVGVRRYFLSSASLSFDHARWRYNIEAAEAETRDLSRVPKSIADYGLPVSFNGAMLVESLHGWAPMNSVLQTGYDFGRLRSVLPNDVFRDIVSLKGFRDIPVAPPPRLNSIPAVPPDETRSVGRVLEPRPLRLDKPPAVPHSENRPVTRARPWGWILAKECAMISVRVLIWPTRLILASSVHVLPTNAKVWLFKTLFLSLILWWTLVDFWMALQPLFQWFGWS